MREELGISTENKTRIFEIFRQEGLRWWHEETWFGERVDPYSRAKKGALERLRLEAPANSAILDTDEMGPTSAKSYPGQQAKDITKRPAERATQEIDYGRRGKGYVFGALWETQGDCWTQCYPGRTIPNCIDFLSYVDSQVPSFD